MIVCVAEDRKSCEVALKLTLLGLARHSGELKVELFYPAADDAFVAWLRRCPRVVLNANPVPGAYSWNVKPHALLSLLQKGYDDVLWIDSDIIVARDIRPLFEGMDTDTMVVTQEALYGHCADPDGIRARGWGFEVGRELFSTANTGVVRATRAHLPLLERWQALLESDEYRRYQSGKWYDRPIHMYGDQDVLTALLASREFAAVPVRFLRRGSNIVQYFGPYGYTCAERIGNMLHGPPHFYHSQVNKPWLLSGRPPAKWTARSYFDALYLDVSPYIMAARSYRAEVEADDEWMRPRTMAGGVLRVLGLGYIPLIGLPLALLADVIRVVKRMLKRMVS